MQQYRTPEVFEDSERLRPVAVVGAFLAMLVLALVAIAMPKGDMVLVIGSPGSTPGALARVISDAGGTWVSSTRFDWMVVAQSDSGDFPTRLFHSGAMLVVDHMFAAGCTQRTST